MKVRHWTVQGCIALSTLAFGVACSDEDPALPYKGNYFPLTPGSNWTYELKRNCDWPNESEMCVETQAAKTLNETLEWDEDYKGIQTPVLAQFVKVLGSEYFATGYYIPEYKFLDDALPAGGKWGHEGEFDYERYEIREVNASKIIKDRIYTNVIVVEVEYSYGGDPVVNNVYYYAKDIGLIYRKQVATYKERDPQLWEFSLKRYSIGR